MAVLFKSIIERRLELERLIEAISNVVSWIETSGHFVDAAPSYRDCLREAIRLRSNGFDQPSLSALARSIPLLIDLHAHWEPPSIAKGDGSYITPSWFDELKPLHDNLVARAEELRVIGRA